MGWWLDVDYHDNYIIIQSTNLFDKDGEEIFEGSIVELNNSKRGWVDSQQARVKVLSCDNLGDLGEIESTKLKVIGHVLSDPELLKENVC